MTPDLLLRTGFTLALQTGAGAPADQRRRPAAVPVATRALGHLLLQAATAGRVLTQGA